MERDHDYLLGILASSQLAIAHVDDIEEEFLDDVRYPRLQILKLRILLIQIPLFISN